jgi:hypothetical protein
MRRELQVVIKYEPLLGWSERRRIPCDAQQGDLEPV